MELLRRSFARVPAVGVALDLMPDRAPQQLVYRLVEGLADNVPAGNFKERRNGLRNLTGPSEILAEHARDEGLHVEGVFAENVAGRRFAQVAKNAVSAVERPALPHSDQTVIGLYFDYGQITPFGAQHHRRHFGYLHWSPLSMGTGFRPAARIL